MGVRVRRHGLAGDILVIARFPSPHISRQSHQLGGLQSAG
jgi:hypothetical protein